MFRRAVQSHADAEESKKPLDKLLFPSSSPSSNSTANQGVPPNVLRPTASNTLNGLENRRPTLYATPAVKRTSSGLAKVLGNNGSDDFQEVSSHAATATTANDAGLIKQQGSKASSVVVFDDDFDSDVELEVENPAAKGRSTSYPKKPSYPAVHQKAHLHTQSTYDTAAAYVAEAPPSTQPLPWSSSPDSHLGPPPRHVPAVVNHQTPVSNDTEPVPRPPKRRTLPWLESGTKEQQPASPKYIWDTTASAMKEQRDAFRKTHKKATKTDQATDDEPIKVNAVAKKSKAVSRPHLSKEQRHVLDLVVEKGNSVFFTGSAGTGKSVLLREIIAILRKKHQRESDRVAITASTGLAACNIGGVTLHSFAGIGLGKEDVPELVKKIKRNSKARQRWLRTKVLIVDEVSMVDGDLFDKLEAIARQLRNNGRPFGGIQVVITGDFFQLPPVPSGRPATFAFDAKSWASAIDHTIGLHHVFRQKDPVFANMLNEMREGRLSQHSIKTFRDLSRPVKDGGECEATELFPTRAEVETANNTKMQQLSGEVMRFEAKDGGSVVDKVARDKLLANCMAPQELMLKKGAQVMLIKNIDENLVNGSLGKVLGFMNEEMFSSYNAEPELFTSPADDDEELNPQQKKERIKLEILKASTSQCWPVVRFINADGTTRDLLCNREVWKVELPNGEVQASRAQVPLILAWALSIHKAQGQTLEKVKVDLGRVFEKGQAYVALSRATCIDGLQVLRFDPTKVMAHDRVRNFYSGLSRAEGPEH